MPKSIFTGEHQVLVEVLVAARKRAGMTQTDLADKIGKDQTFISIIERSQRRVDVLEFCAIARALNADPEKLFCEVIQRLPENFKI